jgi:hypothetical protein
MKIDRAGFRKILAGYLVVVSSAYLGAITFCNIPTENMDVAKIILGFVLGSILGVLTGFYFGDSEKKED